MLEYGITTSRADYWVHVTPKDYGVWVYKRTDMLVSIRENNWPQRELKTAKGFLVSCNAQFLRFMPLPDCWLDQFDWENAQSDAELGRWAETIVRWALAEPILPENKPAIELVDKEEQFTGIDFRKSCSTTYEVKADVQGGKNGTGNLFVQTHEYQHQHQQRHAHR